MSPLDAIAAGVAGATLGCALGVTIVERWVFGKERAELEEQLARERAMTSLAGSVGRRFCTKCRHCDDKGYHNKITGLSVSVCKLRPSNVGGFELCAAVNPKHDCSDWENSA